MFVVIESYIVCGYCFTDIKIGSRCEVCQKSPARYAIRYRDLAQEQLFDDDPNILGQETDEGLFIGAQIILAPEVHLCDDCKEEFEEACQWIVDIITKCVKSTCSGSEGLDKGGTLIGK